MCIFCLWPLLGSSVSHYVLRRLHFGRSSPIFASFLGSSSEKRLFRRVCSSRWGFLVCAVFYWRNRFHPGAAGHYCSHGSSFGYAVFHWRNRCLPFDTVRCWSRGNLSGCAVSYWRNRCHLVDTVRCCSRGGCPGQSRRWWWTCAHLLHVSDMHSRL